MSNLFFSNPPHPDTQYQPEMKDLSELDGFKNHAPAANVKFDQGNLPKVAVYSVAEDVVVTAANPLVISGTGPVAVSYGTVTIEPGGQIKVLTTADIRIQKLIKN